MALLESEKSSPSEEERQQYKKAKELITEYSIGIGNVSEQKYRKAVEKVREFDRKYSPV